MRLLRALPGSLSASRAVLRNPDLARVQLSWAGSMFGEFLSLVALGVFAYEAGGAAAVGVVAAIQLAPAALLAPFAAVLGDRVRRELVVFASQVIAAGALAAAAVVAWADAPVGVVYGLAALLAVSNQAFYPAQTALIPLLAGSAKEVTAASGASSLIRNAAGLAAPALGGLILLVGSTTILFAVSAASFGTAALLAAGIRGTAGVRAARRSRGPLQELLAGFGAARHDSGTALVLLLFGVHGIGRGALGVLLVVIPLQLLELGEASVGFFNAAVGIGGLAGAVATVAVSGRRRLSGPIAVGLVLTGGPLMLAAAATPAAWLIVCVTVAGAGIATVSTTGTVLLVRSVRDDVLARVLGVLGTVRAAAMTAGSLAAPLLVHLVGVRWTLVAVGTATPMAALATRKGLRRIDDASFVPEHELRLLRTSPVFASILPVALERLAARLEPVTVPAGTSVVQEGDPGDRVYLVARGRLDVTAGGRLVGSLDPGDLFGEMALLRSRPRNATVTAVVESTLYALGEDEFMAAVTGHPDSSRSADDLITTRLDARAIADQR